MTWLLRAVLGALLLLAGRLAAQPFQLPTANRAVLEAGAEESFFQGTAGKPWTSGQFGCVRTEGRQFHEGADIRCLQRDRRGEPTDPVLASADGTVAYVNAKAGLSNYGNYVVLRHSLQGLEVYTLYAHLSAIEAGVRIGKSVKAGQRVGTMGRTANTKQAITKDRAHLHFEINLVVNERYSAWHQATLKGMRNDHGNFNGRNLLGLDPAAIFREQARLGTNFSLVRFIQGQPELCRVAVRDTKFPWVRRYAALVQRNPVAEREGVAGYELGLTFNGLPSRIVPRAASELKGARKVTLLGVNAAECQAKPCGKLVFKRGQLWTLLPRAEELLDLLTY
jgi:murein DD-endopeptidase MepM/ murein hydrolase activator NlpD